MTDHPSPPPSLKLRRAAPPPPRLSAEVATKAEGKMEFNDSGDLGLRFMRPSESALFAAWEMRERPYPWSQKNFEETISAGASKTLVHENESGIMGFAVIQIVQEEAYLSNLMIAPLHRRRGEGAKLLGKIMIWSRRNGADGITLDVDPANVAAVNLYRKIGFEILERRMSAYPKGEDALVMRKKL